MISVLDHNSMEKMNTYLIIIAMAINSNPPDV